MKVLICHERFLFRYGADRVFLLLARGLRELGHDIVLMGLRYDDEVVAQAANRTIRVDPDNTDYSKLDDDTSAWLEENWDGLFERGAEPDLVVVGGWPFFGSIPFFRRRSIPPVFSDHGVVPMDGYDEGARAILAKLHRLRQTNLQQASAVIAVSEFIRKSQSEPDACSKPPTYVILNGADHMESSLWQAAALQSESGEALAIVRALKKQGRRLTLATGRWERGCYKNSEAALEVLRGIREEEPQAALLALGEEDPRIPGDLKPHVHFLGFPDDQELVEIMRLCDLGVSVSQWEGFNLPLAEMQWLRKPCLAFDLGAHPEVALHPERLCADPDDMVRKAVLELQGGQLSPSEEAAASESFRGKMTWAKVVSRYERVFDDLVRSKRPGRAESLRRIVVDATFGMTDIANSGVIRVTRQLGRHLQDFEDPIFVFWDFDRRDYLLPTPEQAEVLSRFNGPRGLPLELVSPSWEERRTLDDILPNLTSGALLLLSEVRDEGHYAPIRIFARDREIPIASVFYDAIPMLRPEFCSEEIAERHQPYMEGLAETHLAIAISEFSASCLREFWRDRGLSGSVVANLLPGEFGTVPRATEPRPRQGDPVQILCVSTLEPRKNHRTLIEAVRLIASNRPELDWRLTLVGNRYAGAEEIADFVEQTSEEDSRIRWLGIVDDGKLHELYDQSDFTVYPSIIEGFGMPVLESLWHGRPCICSREGVMAELALDGGCLTANVQEPESLVSAILELATDEELYVRLAGEAVGRPLKNWEAYVNQFLSQLEPLRKLSEEEDLTESAADWRGLIYGGKDVASGRLTDVERLSLMAILNRHRPTLSVNVGSSLGATLPLLSSYSKAVIAISNEGEAAGVSRSLPNVNSLSGPSDEILPGLFRELDEAALPIGLVVIDADDTATQLRGKIELIFKYRPSEPMILLITNSSESETRQAILETDWAQSRYCRSVETDLVPGTAEANCRESKYQRGGLALAFFSPEPRRSDLVVHSSGRPSGLPDPDSKPDC